MKQSTQDLREASRRAELAYQRAVHQPDVTLKRKAVASSPSPKQQSFDPHQKGAAPPTSLARAMYPHLIREEK